MKNIFLNGLMMNEIEDIKHITPTEFKFIFYIFLYKHFIPNGIIGDRYDFFIKDEKTRTLKI